jgi:hypothetical protein
MRTIAAALAAACLAAGAVPAPAADPALEGRWSEEQARAWYDKLPWLVGCNYMPSHAINQLEMWQADTFDPAANDRELGFAQQLGFTSVRVFLHDIPWKQDPKGFAQRIDRFLGICEKHKIGALFVLFDSCWDPFPKAGKQHEPKPHVHNSGWVQSPGVDILKDPARHDELKDYVVGVIGRFRDDKRVHGWDLFNEPDNRNDPAYIQHEPGNKADLALQLLRKTYAWAREAKPTQPLCSGIWMGDWSSHEKFSPMQRLQIDASDVVNFHCYGNIGEMRGRVEALKRYNRPLLCTEYMARVTGSTFQNILPYLKEQKVAAYNWGFVNGKIQTIYPWDSWRKAYTAEPPVWFHDILRRDGSPFDPKEVETIRSLTGAGR